MKVEITRYKSGKRAGTIRKEEVRIDYHDTWSMDWTIAKIAAPMLKQLIETKHGAGRVDDEDVPEELRTTSCAKPENDWDTDDNWFKRWDWVLQEMHYAMDRIASDCDDEPTPEDFGWTIPEGGMLGNPMPIDISDKWIKASRVYHERIDNGCRLFGKYFRSLWD